MNKIKAKYQWAHPEDDMSTYIYNNEDLCF
jgi:hypothetical protein